MMSQILSLSKARKAKARAEKNATAEANRIRFGRTKGEKSEAAAKATLAAKTIDAHKREKP